MMIYLATPYSHPDRAVRELRFREVNRVAAELMRAGVHVFSPISHSHSISLMGNLPTDWGYWKEYDRAMLKNCEKLVVLMQLGWHESEGVQAEIALAKELGLPVEFLRHKSGCLVGGY
jgi:hypothetical protein